MKEIEKSASGWADRIRSAWQSSVARAHPPPLRRYAKQARFIAEYIEPGGPRDAGETITQLIAVLDNQDLARAIDRLEKVHGFRLGSRGERGIAEPCWFWEFL